MSHPSSLRDCCVGHCQCLVRKAKAETYKSQIRLCCHMDVESGVFDNRAVRDGIMERKQMFQMRPGWSELTSEHQVPTGGVATQYELSGIISLLAQAQQIFVQALSQIELTAAHVIAGLSKWNL